MSVCQYILWIIASTNFFFVFLFSYDVNLFSYKLFILVLDPVIRLYYPHIFQYGI